MEEVCKQNDTKKLAKLLPGAHAVEPAMLPVVAQRAQGSLPMIEDCQHWTWATTDGSGGEAKVQFRRSTLEEHPSLVASSEWGTMVRTCCHHGEAGHDAPFWQCTQCHKVLCQHCTRETGIVKGPNGEWYRLAEVEDALTEVQAAASKATAEAEHFGLQSLVWRHPQRPLPFYVLDGEKLADTEELAWIIIHYSIFIFIIYYLLLMIHCSLFIVC